MDRGCEIHCSSLRQEKMWNLMSLRHKLLPASSKCRHIILSWISILFSSRWNNESCDKNTAHKQSHCRDKQVLNIFPQSQFWGARVVANNDIVLRSSGTFRITSASHRQGYEVVECWSLYCSCPTAPVPPLIDSSLQRSVLYCALLSPE